MLAYLYTASAPHEEVYVRGGRQTSMAACVGEVGGTRVGLQNVPGASSRDKGEHTASPLRGSLEA